jgi:hypothetical protein
MTYYAEVKGQRIKISEWDAYMRLREDGWYNIIMQPGVTIIGKKGV